VKRPKKKHRFLNEKLYFGFNKRDSFLVFDPKITKKFLYKIENLIKEHDFREASFKKKS